MVECIYILPNYLSATAQYTSHTAKSAKLKMGFRKLLVHFRPPASFFTFLVFFEKVFFHSCPPFPPFMSIYLPSDFVLLRFSFFCIHFFLCVRSWLGYSVKSILRVPGSHRSITAVPLVLICVCVRCFPLKGFANHLYWFTLVVFFVCPWICFLSLASVTLKVGFCRWITQTWVVALRLPFGLTNSSHKSKSYGLRFVCLFWKLLNLYFCYSDLTFSP